MELRVLDVARDGDRWDAFCEAAPMATFLHTRRFLSYHGIRFRDRSMIITRERDWVGMLPAAEHPNDPRVVVSHPGITYGGVLHAGRLKGPRMVEAFELLIRHFACAGYRSLQYKAVPSIYHRCPSQDDLYALFRYHARCFRRDLS